MIQTIREFYHTGKKQYVGAWCLFGKAHRKLSLGRRRRISEENTDVDVEIYVYGVGAGLKYLRAETLAGIWYESDEPSQHETRTQCRNVVC